MTRSRGTGLYVRLALARLVRFLLPKSPSTPGERKGAMEILPQFSKNTHSNVQKHTYGSVIVILLIASNSDGVKAFQSRMSPGNPHVLLALRSEK